MKTNLLNFLLVCICAFVAPSAKAGVIYVDSSATGTNNGQSWSNAYTDLQSGLNSALPMDSIWVAKGTYYPTTGTARNISFTLPDSVKLLGGFDGTENSACERDWIANPTILSADIGVQGDSTDNSYHVVYAWHVYEEALLDGFVLRDGNADVSTSHYNNGGGLHMEESEFPVRNCLFAHNSAINGGGGLYMNQNQQFLIEDCIFEYNFCPGGGGMYCNWAVGSMSRCTFRYNKAGNGAGAMMSSVGGLSFYDCVFHDNLVTQGAGGGLRLTDWSGDMINCWFESNTSRVEGGGLAVYVGNGNIEKTTFLNNVTTLQNTNAAGGGGFYAEAGLYAVKLAFKNCSFIGNISGSTGGGARIYSLKTRFLNTVFSGNQSNLEGGGLFWGSGNDSLRIFNGTFTNNVSGLGGGGVYNYSVWYAPPVWNTIFWNNSPNQVEDQPNTNHPAMLQHCIVSGGYTGIGNLNVNPMFVDADGPDNTVGTLDDDLRLMPGSPAIQAGKPDTSGTSLPPTDHKLEPRIVLDTVDIGAYEGIGCAGIAPIVDAGQDQVLCGDSLALNAVAPGFGCGNWINGQGCFNIIEPYNPSSAVTLLGTGTHFIVWEVTYCDTVIRDTVVVTNYGIPPSPSITLTNPATFCDGGSTLLSLPGGYSGYLWNTGDTTQQILVDSTGIFQGQVISANGCVSPYSVPVTITELPLPPAPQVSPSGPLEVCQGTPVTLGGPGGYSQYNWSNGGITPSISPTSSGFYSLAVTDSNGCTSPSSAAVSLTINPIPAVPLVQVLGSNPICSGSTIGLQGPPGYPIYSWSNGPTTQNISVGVAGTYTLQVTDSNSCQSPPSSPIAVQVHPLLVPAITFSGNSITCPGGSMLLQGPVGYSNYNWSNGATGINTTVTTPGSYSLSLTDLNGCPSAPSNILTFANYPAAPNPIITPNRDTTLCHGDTIQLTVTPGGQNYSWSTGATSQNLEVAIAGGFSVTITDQNGCISEPSDTISVLVQALPATPVVLPDGPTAFCAGESVALSVQSPPGGLSYLWSNGLASPNLLVDTSGTFMVVAFDSLGCRSDASSPLEVIVFPTPPAPGIVSDPAGEICQGDTTFLSGPAGYQNYIWSEGSSGQTIFADSTGTYSLQVVDSMGCVSATSANVQVVVASIPSKPQIEPVKSIQICASEKLTLNGPDGFLHYLWSNGATGQVLEVPSSGEYWIRVGNTLNCLSLPSDTAVVELGVAELLSRDNITLFPVPNSGNFFLRLPPMDEVTLEVRIYDALGKSLFSGYIEVNDCQPVDFPFSFKNLATGIYFMRIIGEEQSIDLKFEVHF